MNLTLLTSAIAAAVAGVAGFGLAWQLQNGTISELNLKAANERISSARVARATIERTSNAVMQAQNAAAGRAVVLRRESDAAGFSGNGLRSTSTATVRASEDFTDACRSIIAAYDSVVATGSDLLREVARDADQCGSDLQMIQEAWPR